MDHTAPLAAVLLDIDGTLLNSNDAHAQAWVDAGAEAGHPLSFDKIRCLIGMGGDGVLREIGVDADSSLAEELTRLSTEIFSERYLPTLMPFPGARALVQRMREANLKLVVATSAGESLLEGLLERAQIADLIDEATSASEVEASKPSPAIVKVALKRAGFPKDRVLMLGDTPYDVEAASRAGVGIVAVRCGGWSDADLAGSVAVYDGPAELLDAYDASPFSR